MIDMPEILKLGTLYIEGEPVSSGTSFCNKEGEITIGNTVSGKELSFLKLHGKYVATDNIYKDVPWAQLAQYDCVYGKKVNIDGAKYICRCMDGGTDPTIPNEWDKILSKVGTREKIWNNSWMYRYFWTMSVPLDRKDSIVTRGYQVADAWRYTNQLNTNVGICFRPILEPLHEVETLDDRLIGSIVSAYGPTGFVRGHLIKYSDYDLTIAPSSGSIEKERGHLVAPSMIGNPTWFVEDGTNIVVDMSKVSILNLI